MPLRKLHHRGFMVLVACLPTLCFATAPASGFPTPGLYQVGEIRSTRDKFKDGVKVRSRQSHVDEKTGGGTIRYSRPGRETRTQTVPGQGPGTTCIPKESSNRVPFLGEDGCTSKEAVTTAAGTTFSLSCPNLQLEGSVRRIDSKTWEYELFTTTSGPGTHASSNKAAEKILEHAARTASTASERKEAAEALHMLREARAEEAREAAKAPPADDSFPDDDTTTVDKTRSIWRLTRIADKCPAAPKR